MEPTRTQETDTTTGNQEVNNAEWVGNEDYFFGVAEVAGRRSKCRKAPAGAVLVDRAGVVRSIGGDTRYLSCCWDDEVDESRQCLANHPEYLCLIQAHLPDLEDSTIFVTDPPCDSCLRLSWQMGVARVVYPHGHVATYIVNPDRKRQ